MTTYDLRTHDGVVVARLTILDDDARPNWVTIHGRAFFWDDAVNAFVAEPP
jgi:hypothetical protein